jgi:hypothetical protein
LPVGVHPRDAEVFGGAAGHEVGDHLDARSWSRTARLSLGLGNGGGSRRSPGFRVARRTSRGASASYGTICATGVSRLLKTLSAVRQQLAEPGVQDGSAQTPPPTLLDFANLPIGQHGHLARVEASESDPITRGAMAQVIRMALGAQRRGVVRMVFRSCTD